MVGLSAGIVESVGEDVTSVKPGDHVIAVCWLDPFFEKRTDLMLLALHSGMPVYIQSVVVRLMM